MTQGTQKPNLSDVLAMALRMGTAKMNIALAATIVAYDPSSQKASVQPVVTPRVDDVLTDKEIPGQPFPIIPNLPVRWQSSSLGSQTFGLGPGDPCQVIVNDRDTDAWRNNGTAISLALDSRRFDLSDGYVVPGGRSFNPAAGLNAPLAVGTDVDSAGAHVIASTLPSRGVLLGSAVAPQSVLLGDLSETNLLTWLNGFTPLLAALTAPVVTDELAWIATVNTAAGAFQPIHSTFVGQVSSGVHRSLKVKVDL